VVCSPYTTHGWRPSSVTTQPHSMATIAASPLTAPSSQNSSGRGHRRRRHPVQAAHSPTSSRRDPRPTMTSKLRWISHTTGGRSAGGTSHPLRVDLRPTLRLSAPAGTTLRVGRAEDNDVEVDDLSVSRHHAELRNTGDGFEILDLGSRNGTFLNGTPVFRAPVTEQDVIGIGPATFRLVGDELREFLDRGDVSLVARDLTVRDGGQVRLDRVSFPIGERSLVAVIGPSGAGKSTLLHALTGLRPATEGTVRYNNRDLYAEYAELR